MRFSLCYWYGTMEFDGFFIFKTSNGLYCLLRPPLIINTSEGKGEASIKEDATVFQ